MYHTMGKITQGIGTAALATGNTLATPVRRWGELANGLANIPRQGYSSTKNIAEVSKQTLNALANNFLNFSKVEGKWYQKMVKVPINAVSACTRRPFMIAWAGVASTLNQWVRQPFKKLLYTPKTMFKGIKNATRIFSKKKGFDFQNYDTHETGNIWITDHTNLGFLGSKVGSSSTETSKPSETKKVEKTKEEVKKVEVKKPEVKKETKNTIQYDSISKAEMDKMEREGNDAAADAILAEHGYWPWPKFGSVPVAKNTSDISSPKNIQELKNKQTAESQAKDQEEASQKDWESLDESFKKQLRKSFTEQLGQNPNKEGVIQWWKKWNLGNTIEEILPKVEKDYPEMAGYLKSEVLKNAA